MTGSFKRFINIVLIALLSGGLKWIGTETCLQIPAQQQQEPAVRSGSDSNQTGGQEDKTVSEIAYPQSSKAIVIERISTGGLLLVEMELSTYLEKVRFPDFILYGDGTVIFSHREDIYGSPALFQGKLNKEEIQRLLQCIVVEGDFFKLQREYQYTIAIDGGAITIKVNTLTKSHQVTFIYFRTADELKRLQEDDPVRIDLQKILRINGCLENFTVPQVKEFLPERVRLFVRRDLDIPGGDRWTIQEVNLSQIAEGEKIGGYGVKTISGSLARKIARLMKGQDAQVVTFRGKRYVIMYRPLFPHEL